MTADRAATERLVALAAQARSGKAVSKAQAFDAVMDALPVLLDAADRADAEAARAEAAEAERAKAELNATKQWAGRKAAEDERDALRGQVARVEALGRHLARRDHWLGMQVLTAAGLNADDARALAGPTKGGEAER